MFLILYFLEWGLDQKAGVAQEARSHLQSLFSFMNIYDLGEETLLAVQALIINLHAEAVWPQTVADWSIEEKTSLGKAFFEAA